jgi:hypothetical protein
VNAGEADTLATYRLTTAGKRGSFTARNARSIPVKSAVYNDVTDSVALVPRKPFGLTKPVQLRIHGLLPGGDAVAVLSKSSVRIAARTGQGALPGAALQSVDDRKSGGSREETLHQLVTSILGARVSKRTAPPSQTGMIWRPAR